MSKIELRPCPFCGAPAKETTYRGEENELAILLWTYGVACTGYPGGTDYVKTREHAAEAWNRRVTPQHEPPENKSFPALGRDNGAMRQPQRGVGYAGPKRPAGGFSRHQKKVEKGFVLLLTPRIYPML